MLKPDEELEMRANGTVIQPDHPCRNCGRRFDEHLTLLNARFAESYCCGCPCFEPADAEDFRDEETPDA